MDFFQNIFDMTGFGSLLTNPGYILMILIGCILLFLGISKKYEPLLLVPIGFGIIIANIPNSNLGVVPVDPSYGLIQIANEHGIINLLYYSLIKTGFLPPLIFMGIGALTDFGPMLKNLRLVFFGAAAQIGIFSVLIIASFLGFDNNEAAALAIIGGADGPTAIYTSIILAPHLLGPIAIAAYSYMALVPVIIPAVVRLLVSKKELLINMKKQDESSNNPDIKNLDIIKIASSDVKDKNLVSLIGQARKPVIASSGGCSLEDLVNPPPLPILRNLFFLCLLYTSPSPRDS